MILEKCKFCGSPLKKDSEDLDGEIWVKEFECGLIEVGSNMYTTTMIKEYCKKGLYENNDIDISSMNQLEDIYVSLEKAKELKRLGFSKPVKCYYLDKDLAFVSKGFKMVKESQDSMNHNDYDDFIYSAPTWREASDFLFNLLKNNTLDLVFEEDDLNVIHDVIFDLYNISVDENKCVIILKTLPQKILLEIVEYGASDTLVREQIHTFLNENKPENI